MMFSTTQATNTANANGGAAPLFMFAPAIGAFTQAMSCP